MARPIEATPVLRGKDARTFLDQMRIEKPVSQERKDWLNQMALDSKASEKSTQD